MDKTDESFPTNKHNFFGYEQPFFVLWLSLLGHSNDLNIQVLEEEVKILGKNYGSYGFNVRSIWKIGEGKFYICPTEQSKVRKLYFVS